MEHNQPDKELVSAHNLTEKPSIELETVEKAMRGDKEAFSALFMQTYRSMYLVVRRFLERDEDIYDALQNGYIKAYKYLSRLQAPEAFVSWLKKTMENAARDIPRRRHRPGNSAGGYGRLRRRADGGGADRLRTPGGYPGGTVSAGLQAGGSADAVLL